MMTTIVSKIQESLVSRIVSGDLKPGAKLDEKSLAAEFGVSRTPIREAIRQLGARGLIELVAGRGSIVAQISIDQLSDMLDAIGELEGLCAQLAAQRMTLVEKVNLQELHDETEKLTCDHDFLRYLELNHKMHELICKGARNVTMATMTRELRLRLAPFRQTQAGDFQSRLARAYAEHSMVVIAILNGEPNTAYEAMRMHNARLSSGILRLLRSGAGL